MSGTRFNLRTIGLIFADAAIIFGGVVLALYLRVGLSGADNELNFRNGWLKILLATVVSVLVFYFYDLYDFTLLGNRRELMFRMITAVGVAWVLLALLFYFIPQLLIGRGVSIISLPIVLAGLVIWRFSIHFLTGHPEIGEKVLVVGSGKAAIDTAKAIFERRDAGYRMIGFVTDNPDEVLKKLPQTRILGTTDDLEKIVKDEGIERIVMAVIERRGRFPGDVLLRMSLAGDVSIEECTSFYERVTGQVHLEMVRPSWLIFDGRGRDTKLQMVARESVHRLLALIGLILSLPIALITAILIKLESRGPVFYRQERVGKNGRAFEVLKFRSMKVDAEENGPVWALADDDRATFVGKIIRKIRVDEIPQFWNIIKGEMNFVGPRPERPHFVSQLANEIHYYEHRHLVAPGLTGWAQVKYPYGASVDDAKQKLQYDLYYIKNQSLPLDMVIVFETVKTVLFGRGGR